jgi:hypothetical protein
MKSIRPVGCIVLFFAVVFLGDRLLSLVAARIVRYSKNQFVRMYEGTNPADILFLGDSRVDRNIDFKRVQDLTARSCLNLSLGGNSVLVSEALLEDYRSRYGNPELVVLELSQTTADPETMGEMAIFSYYSANIAALSKSINPAFAAFQRVFKSLTFNDPAFWRLASEAVRDSPPRLLQNVIPREIIDRWADGHSIERPIIEKNMQALQRICQFADHNAIEIRLIIGPYWKGFREGISNYESWKSALRVAVNGHPIHDYSEVFSDREEFFNDEMHLNATGAASFVDRLLEDGLL